MKFLIVNLLIVLAACSAVGDKTSVPSEKHSEMDSLSCPNQGFDAVRYTLDSVIADLRKPLREYAAARFSGARAADTVYFNEDYIIDKVMWLNKVLKDNADSKYIGSIREIFDEEDVTMLCSTYHHPEIAPDKVVRPVIRLKFDGKESLARIVEIVDTIQYGCTFFKETEIYKSNDTTLLVFEREDGFANGYKYVSEGSRWIIKNDDFKVQYHQAVFIPQSVLPPELRD